MIVLGIDTSTEQTSVALGTEREILGTVRFAGVHRHDDVMPAIERLLEWTGIDLPFGAERDGRLFGRGVDAKDDHEASPAARSTLHGSS